MGGQMTPSKALEWLREHLADLQSRRPACRDSSCNVCKRFRADDARSAEALAVLTNLAGAGGDQ